MLTLIYAVACSDVCGWFFSQTITLQTIMTAWPPGTGEGGGKLKYIHFCQGCKKIHVESKQRDVLKNTRKNKQRDLLKNTRKNKQRDVPQTKNWPSTRQAVVYANSRSRIVVSSGRLPVSSANTFCIACQYFLYCLQYFLHGLQILFVSSVTAFFGGLHSTSFLQRLQILKHRYLSCPIINIDHCSLIHII